MHTCIETKLVVIQAKPESCRPILNVLTASVILNTNELNRLEGIGVFLKKMTGMVALTDGLSKLI